MNKPASTAAAVWVLVLGTNFVQTLIMPQSTFTKAPKFPWLIVFMPIIIVFGAFRARRPLGEATFGTWIDNRYGRGSYEQFMRMLRLELLFSVMCFCIALEALARVNFLKSPVLPPQLIGFFLSEGMAFLIAYYIRRTAR